MRFFRIIFFKCRHERVGGADFHTAQAALAGTDNTGGALSFRPVSSGRGGVVIGIIVYSKKKKENAE